MMDRSSLFVSILTHRKRSCLSRIDVKLSGESGDPIIGSLPTTKDEIMFLSYLSRRDLLRVGKPHGLAQFPFEHGLRSLLRQSAAFVCARQLSSLGSDSSGPAPVPEGLRPSTD